MKEIWKSIPGYEGLYEASNLGKIKSLKGPSRFRQNKDRVLKPMKEKSGGYLSVTLGLGPKGRKNLKVHRLILMTFHPNNNPDLQTNHIDFNRLNNKLDNLEWCTQKQNTHHSYKRLVNKKGEHHPNSKLSNIIIKDIRKKYQTGKYTQAKLGRMFNIHISTVFNIIHRYAWKHI